MTSVTTWYLEMRDPAQLKPSRHSPNDARIARVEPPMPELNRFLYAAVGGDWNWLDRLPWTYRQWLDYLTAPGGVETWLLTVAGVPAGYFELDARSGDPEIAYFGLLSHYIGQGLGGHLLTAAIERGWQLGGSRVWVHTCSLDHPAALASYQARGFQIYRVDTEEKEIRRAGVVSPLSS